MTIVYVGAVGGGGFPAPDFAEHPGVKNVSAAPTKTATARMTKLMSALRMASAP